MCVRGPRVSPTTEWARLLSKGGDAQERVRAAAHIASCAACADEYRLLHPLRSWAADVERVHAPSRRRCADRWPVARMVAAAPVPRWPPPPVLLVAHGMTLSQLVDQPCGTRSSSRSSRSTSAAVLERGVVIGTAGTEPPGVAANGEQLQQRQTQLATPQLQVPIVDLEPQGLAGARGRRLDRHDDRRGARRYTGPQFPTPRGPLDARGGSHRRERTGPVGWSHAGRAGRRRPHAGATQWVSRRRVCDPAFRRHAWPDAPGRVSAGHPAHFREEPIADRPGRRETAPDPSPAKAPRLNMNPLRDAVDSPLGCSRPSTPLALALLAACAVSSITPVSAGRTPGGAATRPSDFGVAGKVVGISGGSNTPAAGSQPPP